jgi:hypothetical protein
MPSRSNESYGYRSSPSSSSSPVFRLWSRGSSPGFTLARQLHPVRGPPRAALPHQLRHLAHVERRELADVAPARLRPPGVLPLDLDERSVVDRFAPADVAAARGRRRAVSSGGVQPCRYPFIGPSLLSGSGPIRGLVTFGQTFVRRRHGATFRTGVDGAWPPCRCVRLYGTGYEAWAGRRRLEIIQTLV